MYYRLCDHIYLTQFRGELIMLDARKDRYTICSEQFFNLMLDLLGSAKQTIDKSNIQQLINNNIIEITNTPPIPYFERKCDSQGINNVDWITPLEDKTKKDIPIRELLKVLTTLFKVNAYIKVGGLYSAIKLIRKSGSTQLEYIIPGDEKLQDLANIVNKTCFIYPTKTKCLEWAMTYTLLALKCGWKCNLEIGVQNYPFLAHAWVQCGEKVIMDKQNLRTELAIILSEPFRD